MSYDINILVNGNRCKQFSYQNKLYIEAKQGSEYVLEVKNSTWSRILAVCSVDGLDILSGKRALETNPGYVINGYGTGKFDGFRVSNEKVAKFVFDYKGKSYAASKEDGSEKNVGVIAFRLFEEKVKPAPVIVEEHHHHHNYDWWYNHHRYGTPYNPPTIWCDMTLSSTLGDNTTEDLCDRSDSSEKYSCDSIPTKGGSPTYGATLGRSNNPTRGMKGLSNTVKVCSMNHAEPKGFDMGTKWGEAKESKVTEVEFEVGILALSTNIYYASRQSLIEMGVPLGNEKQVNFPEPFADDKYAKPPKGWRG